MSLRTSVLPPLGSAQKTTVNQMSSSRPLSPLSSLSPPSQRPGTMTNPTSSDRFLSSRLLTPVITRQDSDDMALALATLNDVDLERACSATPEMSSFCRINVLLAERQNAIMVVKTRGMSPKPVEVKTVSAWSEVFEDIVQYAAGLDDAAFQMFVSDQIARAIILSNPLLSTRLTKMEAAQAVESASPKRVSLGSIKTISASSGSRSLSETFVKGKPEEDIILLATFPAEEVEAAREHEYIDMLVKTPQYKNLTKQQTAGSPPKGILRSPSTPSAELCSRCASMGLMKEEAWVNRTSPRLMSETGMATRQLTTPAPTMGGKTLIAPLTTSGAPRLSPLSGQNTVASPTNSRMPSVSTRF